MFAPEPKENPARMKRVHYVDDSFLTGDELADALLEYAEALAKQSTSASIDVPALLADGSTGMVKVLVGPASQLFAVPEPPTGDELLDDAALRVMVHETELLAPTRVEVETDHVDTSCVDDYDE